MGKGPHKGMVGDVAWAPCPGCMVVSGVEVAWRTARPKIVEMVRQARLTYPDVVVTGHAAGGAIAVAAAMELRVKGYGATLVSLGVLFLLRSVSVLLCFFCLVSSLLQVARIETRGPQSTDLLTHKHSTPSARLESETRISQTTSAEKQAATV